MSERVESTPDLYLLFVKEAVEDLEKQWGQARYYKHFQVTEMTETDGAIFYVRRFGWKVYDFDCTHPEYFKKVVARFDRTRIVTIIPVLIETQTGDSVSLNIMKCTCQYFERNRKKCRHMYVITNQGPTKMILMRST